VKSLKELLNNLLNDKTFAETGGKENNLNLQNMGME
jgi:hypothetical protein